jgi:hypothetical protein
MWQTKLIKVRGVTDHFYTAICIQFCRSPFPINGEPMKVLFVPWVSSGEILSRVWQALAGLNLSRRFEPTMPLFERPKTIMKKYMLTESPDEITVYPHGIRMRRNLISTFFPTIYWVIFRLLKKLRGFSPQGNYTDWATVTCRRC